jgi:hypothetical protein
VVGRSHCIQLRAASSPGVAKLGRGGCGRCRRVRTRNLSLKCGSPKFAREYTFPEPRPADHCCCDTRTSSLRTGGLQAGRPVSCRSRHRSKNCLARPIWRWSEFASVRSRSGTRCSKSRGAADLQPAQPFEILSSSIETTKHVCCFVQDDQRGRKVFDVYRNDKRDMLALPYPCFTLHITGATAEKEFSRSATKLSRPFRTSNFP